MTHEKHSYPVSGESPKAQANRIAAENQDDSAKTPTRRANRYVYHIHGHAKLHATSLNQHGGDEPNGPIVPFEVVLRRPFAIDSDDTMEEVRHEVRGHVVDQLVAQDSPYQVGDVMIRGVSRLHRILVEADDPEGPAVRIMS